MIRLRRPLVLPLMLVGLCSLSLAGCQALGVLASAAPKAPIKAAYDGLRGQPVSVMVWADRGLRSDWNTLREDLAGSIQKRLATGAQQNLADLAGTTFPYSAESVVKYQRDNPGFDAEPILDLAPRFRKVTRLIYVEVTNLTTRTSQSIVMYRGHATASVKVLAIEGGKATVVYEEPNLTVSFPERTPEDGRLDGNDASYYAGTINALADEIALRFFEHPAEAEAPR